MKRAENCVDAKINHIRFENDCLVFEFAKSKSLPDGGDHVGPWHVYANPHEPHMCPVLALAKYLFTNVGILSGKSPLFEGESQYSRYSNIFSKLINENMDELKQFGVKVGDYGTHSLRKGVATMVASGCTVSPPIGSICIRVGWSMGGVKDRYIKFESAGDHYVGRCAACLDQTTKEFAVSPPFFDYSPLPVEQRAQKRKEIGLWLLQRIPNDDSVSGPVLHLAYMCFATVCYHYEFLRDTLSPNSAFRSCAVFKDIPDYFLELAVVKYSWDIRSQYMPKLTGIPPHIAIMTELKQVKDEIANMKTTLVTNMRDELNKRGVGGAVQFVDITVARSIR